MDQIIYEYFGNLIRNATKTLPQIRKNMNKLLYKSTDENQNFKNNTRELKSNALKINYYNACFRSKFSLLIRSGRPLTSRWRWWWCPIFASSWVKSCKTLHRNRNWAKILVLASQRYVPIIASSRKIRLNLECCCQPWFYASWDHVGKTRWILHINGTDYLLLWVRLCG